MSEWTGVVVAKSENGIKVVDKGAWLNFSLPDYRGTPFDSVKAGDRVRIEYSEVEKDGSKRTYISVIENLSRPQASPAPDEPFPAVDEFPPDDIMRPESGSDQQDGQFRSPKDFRRTSALAQAVAYHGPDGRQDVSLDIEDVILTAQRFEKYLGTGE